MGEDVESALGGAPVGAEAAVLAAIARRIGGLAVPGPDAAAMERMRARFEERTRRRRGAAAWLLGWLGLGLERRPLVQRLAAGAMLLAATAGGAQAAGLDVAGAARVAGEFVVNAARNLDPGRGVGGDSPFAEGTRTPSGSPTAGVTPSPEADPTPGAGSSPEPPAAATPSPGQAGSGAWPLAGTPAATPSLAATPSPAATPTPDSDDDDDRTPETGDGSDSAASWPPPFALPPLGPSATPTPQPTPQPTATPTPGDEHDDDDHADEDRDKEERSGEGD